MLLVAESLGAVIALSLALKRPHLPQAALLTESTENDVQKMQVHVAFTRGNVRDFENVYRTLHGKCDDQEAWCWRLHES